MPSTGPSLQFVRRGDRPRARDWNDIARQLNGLGNIGDDAYVLANGAGKFRGVNLRRLRDPDVVLVRNDTGFDVTGDHPILGLGDPVIEPDDSDEIVHAFPIQFKGELPNEDDHFQKFAILDGPVAEDHFQTGIVSGVAWVRISIESDDDDYADVNGGSISELLSAKLGAAQILWKGNLEAGDTGWALVRLSKGNG